MTDRKSLAAGEVDMWEAYEQDLAPITTPRPVIFEALVPDQSQETMRMGSLVRCDRCGQQREYFARNCTGCAAIDKLVCPCGQTGANHRYSRGTRTKRRMWTCWVQGLRQCMDFPDPIRQASKVIDPGRLSQVTVWEDVEK